MPELDEDELWPYQVGVCYERLPILGPLGYQ